MSPTSFGITSWQRLKHSIVRWSTQKRELVQELRVCLPGIVQKFYPATQTVDVIVATNEYFWIAPVNNIANQPVQVNPQTVAPQISLLQGIPMFIPNGGGLMLTFPIQPGDECDVLFHDTPISGWFQNGNLNNLPFSQRRHSLSDGVAYFGVRSQPNVIPNYSTISAQLRTLDGTTLVDLKENYITVTAQNVTVNSTDCTINATGTATIAGGSVTIGDDVTISNHSWLLHQHTGVQSGSETSLGINPSGP